MIFSQNVSNIKKSFINLVANAALFAALSFVPAIASSTLVDEEKLNLKANWMFNHAANMVACGYLLKDAAYIELANKIESQFVSWASEAEVPFEVYREYYYKKLGVIIAIDWYGADWPNKQANARCVKNKDYLLWDIGHEFNPIPEGPEISYELSTDCSGKSAQYWKALHRYRKERDYVCLKRAVLRETSIRHKSRQWKSLWQ